MKKSWGLTQKILLGEKNIETRWYKNKSKPWDCIKVGDEIYFKDSGEPVTVQARVAKVEQYSELNNEKISSLLVKYSKNDLGTAKISDEISNYVKNKRYAIIIHLTNPKKVLPFDIDKTGYGLQAAWLVVNNINDVKVGLGTRKLKCIKDALSKEGIETQKIEFTSGNYDDTGSNSEVGKLIKYKMPSLTSEIGEFGVINGEYFLVMIVKRNLLKQELIRKLSSIHSFKIYGFDNFMRTLSIDEIFKSSLNLHEEYLQIQFGNIEVDNISTVINLHMKLKLFFAEYSNVLVNQIKVDMMSKKKTLV